MAPLDDEHAVARLRFGLGVYRIAVPETAVRFAADLKSYTVGTLKRGERVQVVEVLLLDENTIRARIDAPSGWITLENRGNAWVEGVESSAPLPRQSIADFLARPVCNDVGSGLAATSRTTWPASIALDNGCAATGSSLTPRHERKSSQAGNIPSVLTCGGPGNGPPLGATPRRTKPSRGQDVKDILEELELSDFYERFVEAGFDRVEAVAAMTEEDMMQVGMRTGHIRLLQQRLRLVQALETFVNVGVEEVKEREGREAELQAQVEELIREREADQERADRDFVQHLMAKQELENAQEQLAESLKRIAVLEKSNPEAVAQSEPLVGSDKDAAATRIQASVRGRQVRRSMAGERGGAEAKVVPTTSIVEALLEGLEDCEVY